MTVHPLEVIGDRPKKRPQQQPPPNANWLLLGVVIFFAVMAYKYFSDGFQKQDGKWVIKEDFKEHVEKKRDFYEDCEVYYLLATQSGYYECKLCDRKTFYLNKGEIWKIGYSCNPDNRYKENYMKQMQLRYVTVFKGDVKQCLQEEQRRLGNYSSLPENLARPDPTRKNRSNGRYKLLLPPGLLDFH